MLLPNKPGASPAAVVPGDWIRLGTALPDTATLDLIVTWWIDRIGAEPHLPSMEREARTPLLYRAFCHALENRDRIARDERRRAALRNQIYETGKGWDKLIALGDEDEGVLRFLADPKNEDYNPDPTSWRRYLATRMPLEKLLRSRFSPVADFPEISRRMHTLIVAGTGHGKSEAIKALLYHYAIHPGAGVIVLDPGRNLAKDIARWPILHRDRRVIYVEPELRPGLTVGINPFAGGHRLDDRLKSHLAEAIALAVSEMTADLTPNMKTLIANCARVLLEQDDATMEDLGRMAYKPPEGARFTDHRRQRLMAAAYDHHDSYVQSFFRYRFDAQTYASSRDALAGRIDGVTGMVDVRNALFGPATLDLEAELNAGKFILVNLNKYGEREQRAAVGRMLVAFVAGIANRRGQFDPPYTPIHLVVDEVTAMASAPMIWTLAEQRKFGLHATLSQQVGGASFTAEEAHALITNTKCRLIATGTPKEGAGLLELRGDVNALPPLSEGQFWVRWGDAPEVHMIQVRGDLVVRNKQGELQPDRNPDHWLPESEWQTYLDQLTGSPAAGGYYRDAKVVRRHEVPPQHHLRPDTAATDLRTDRGTAARTDVRTDEPTLQMPRRGRSAAAPELIVKQTAASRPPQDIPVAQSPIARSEEADEMLKKPELPNRQSPVREPPPTANGGGTIPLRSADVGLQKPVRPSEQAPAPPPTTKRVAPTSKKPGLVRPEKPKKPAVAPRKTPIILHGGEPD